MVASATANGLTSFFPSPLKRREHQSINALMMANRGKFLPSTIAPSTNCHSSTARQIIRKQPTGDIRVARRKTNKIKIATAGTRSARPAAPPAAHAVYKATHDTTRGTHVHAHAHVCTCTTCTGERRVVRVVCRRPLRAPQREFKPLQVSFGPCEASAGDRTNG